MRLSAEEISNLLRLLLSMSTQTAAPSSLLQSYLTIFAVSDPSSVFDHADLTSTDHCSVMFGLFSSSGDVLFNSLQINRNSALCAMTTLRFLFSAGNCFGDCLAKISLSNHFAVHVSSARFFASDTFLEVHTLFQSHNLFPAKPSLRLGQLLLRRALFSHRIEYDPFLETHKTFLLSLSATLHVDHQTNGLFRFDMLKLRT
jgi:hypothetical protein